MCMYVIKDRSVSLSVTAGLTPVFKFGGGTEFNFELMR